MRKDYKQLAPAFRGNLHSLLVRAESVEWKYGLTWYQDARANCQRIGEKTGYSLQVVAGVVAALSPSMTWLRNLAEAEDFLTTCKVVGRKILNTSYKYGCYGYDNKLKAYQISRGKDPLMILGGNKVRAFYTCIMNPDSEEVCIDGHAKCAAYNERKGIHVVTVRDAEYLHLAEAYRVVARERKIRPAQAQAIVWLTWRRMHGVAWLPDERQIPITFQDEVPF